MKTKTYDEQVEEIEEDYKIILELPYNKYALIGIKQEAKELKEEIEKYLQSWKEIKKSIEYEPYDEWSSQTELLWKNNENDIKDCQNLIQRLNKIIGENA